MTPITVAVILGTSREKRLADRAARFVAGIGKTFPDVEIVLVDPTDFSFHGDGNDEAGRDSRYSALTAKADAFFIVTPEYNHSFPGSLKRMLDSEYEHYFRKPVALAGVSNGGWGGTRAVENLLPALRTMGLVATQYSVYFPRIQDIFDEQGRMHQAHVQQYTDNVYYAWEELLWFARLLKAGRDASLAAGPGMPKDDMYASA